MKTALVAAVLLTSGLVAFKNFDNGSIRGTVTPGDAADAAWAISDKDTIKNTVSSGNFEIPNLREGTYKVIIQAKAPYRSAVRENVIVTNGTPTNIGEITLQK